MLTAYTHAFFRMTTGFQPSYDRETSYFYLIIPTSKISACLIEKSASTSFEIFLDSTSAIIYICRAFDRQLGP